MRRLSALAVLFAVLLIGGVVGEAAAQPEPEPTAEPGTTVLGDDVAEALAQAEAQAEAGEDDEADDDGGPSLFERALCGISPALCATSGLAGIPSPGEALADIGEAAADSILEKFAASMAEAVEWTLTSTFGRWLDSESLISSEQAVFELVSGQFFWLAGALTMIGILWQSIRVVVTRSAQTLADLAGALMTIASVSSLGWIVVTMFAEATDAWSAQLIASAIATPQAVENISAALIAMPPMASVLFGAALFVSSVVQDWLLSIREAAVLLISGGLPSLSAARLYGWGRPWLGRAVNTMASVLLWKPVAAATIFGAMTLFGQGETQGAAMTGAAMMFLSIFMLPAMMKLFAHHEIGGGIVSGGGGGRALATGAAVAAGAVLTGGGSAALGAAAKGGAAAAQATTAAPRVRVQDSTGAAPHVPPAPTNRWSHAMTYPDPSETWRVRVLGPRWCRMYSITRGGVLVSLSFRPGAVLAVIDGQPDARYLNTNGVEQ